jgi:hypothetical protein
LSPLVPTSCPYSSPPCPDTPSALNGGCDRWPVRRGGVYTRLLCTGGGAATCCGGIGSSPSPRHHDATGQPLPRPPPPPLTHSAAAGGGVSDRLLVLHGGVGLRLLGAGGDAVTRCGVQLPVRCPHRRTHTPPTTASASGERRPAAATGGQYDTAVLYEHVYTVLVVVLLLAAASRSLFDVITMTCTHTLSSLLVGSVRSTHIEFVLTFVLYIEK